MIHLLLVDNEADFRYTKGVVDHMFASSNGWSVHTVPIKMSLDCRRLRPRRN